MKTETHKLIETGTGLQNYRIHSEDLENGKLKTTHQKIMPTYSVSLVFEGNREEFESGEILKSGLELSKTMLENIIFTRDSLNRNNAPTK